MAGDVVGTTFAAHDRTLPARKLWIAFAAEVDGVIEVDAGAERALTDQPRSLLPAGVVAARGGFEAGSTVEVVGPSGRAFARGMTAIDAGDRQPRRRACTRVICPPTSPTRSSTATTSSSCPDRSIEFVTSVPGTGVTSCGSLGCREFGRRGGRGERLDGGGR